MVSACLRAGALAAALLCPALALAQASQQAGAEAAQATSVPLVFNSPKSAHAGDIVGFQGAHFGDDPIAMLQAQGAGPAIALERINSVGGLWASFRLPPDAQGALVVRIGNAAGLGQPLTLNAAEAFHLDATQVAARGRMRVFGRNLLLPGYTPTLTVDGWPAVLDLAASDEHMLVATAPAQLLNKPQIDIRVDNGNGSGASLLERRIASSTGDGRDPLGLGVGWANAFAAAATRVLHANSDARLAHPMQCNGNQDDSRGLQEAIDLASALGGATVQLPEGHCRLAASVRLKSGVVLQGAGKARTVLLYEASYPLLGRDLHLAGLRDFSLRNAGGGIESALLQSSERVFFQNMAFALQGGVQMFLDGNTNLVIDHCDFLQPRSARGNGPFGLGNSAGLVFTHNRVVYADGSPGFGRVHDAYIADNHISRDVRDNLQSQSVVHSLPLDFAHRVVLLNNVFDVLGGPVTNKVRNDGETILSEGGGGNRTEGVGYVKSASALTLQDPAVRHNVRPFGGKDIPENYALAILGGTGAGQTRRVLDYSAGSFTVDRPWDVVPDSSSRYATFVWGLEKALIKGNTLSHNPRGIWLYQTAVRDVDIIANRITEGGGIYLRTAQNLKDKLFTPMYGVRVAGNRITNTSSEWLSYIHLAFVRMDEADFGLASIGVEIRDNTLQANQPNLVLRDEESGSVEGIVVRARFEGEAQGRSKNQTRLLGTIIQNNRCSGCNTDVLVRDGAMGTVLDGNANSVTGSP